MKRGLNYFIVALAAGLALSPSAKAFDTDDFFRGYIGIFPNQYASNLHQARTMANLEAQRAQLSARIAQAERRGQLSAWQANNLREQLDDNAQLQEKFLADGLLSFAEANRLVMALGNIDARVDTAIASMPVSRSYASTFRRFADIDNLQARIAQRLENGRLDGRLTPFEYQSLRFELNRINNLEAQLRMSGGLLSWGERQRLLNRLAHLDARVTMEMRDSQIAGRSRIWY
ncbi:MAG TPA: hypothetical protein V6D17_09425 [Candidatus Obscuribacterales bacterium]